MATMQQARGEVPVRETSALATWAIRALGASAATAALGCGSVGFYEDTPVPEANDAQAGCQTAPPQRAEELIVREVPNAEWRTSLRTIINSPSGDLGLGGKCKDELATLRADISSAIELTLAQRNTRDERCLSRTGRIVEALYHVEVGFPYLDQQGRPFEIDAPCFAPAMAREAQACVE